MIFVDIGGIVDHHSMSLGERWFLLILVEWLTIITSHLNSLSDGQQFHQYQQNSPLTLTHWVMVNNSTNINKNHLSPKLIEWWSTVPPISTKITSHINSLSDVNNYWWYCWPSLNELRWEVNFVDIGGIVDHHSMSLGKRWFLLILGELLTIIQWVEVRGIFIDRGGIVDHNSLSDGQQFHQNQPESPLT
jgi:hypothetical protein